MADQLSQAQLKAGCDASSPSTTGLAESENITQSSGSKTESASLVAYNSSAAMTSVKPEDCEDSASLSDSVQTFPEEFGRTYHAYRAGSYAFPNDVIEQERLITMGECVKFLMEGELFLAPLSGQQVPKNILDVATGMGDWAIQMGDRFPGSEVIATDLSPIQPKDVPPNVYFYVEDSSEEWIFKRKFDYIHTRSTAGCWSDFETQIAQQAFNALEPGGWFESQEMDSTPLCDDNTLDPKSPVATWFSDLVEASSKLQRPAILGARLKEIYERVGFVDVHQRVFKMPINGWPEDQRLKQLGSMWAENLLDGVAGFSYQLFTKAFGRSIAEIEVSLIDVRRDLVDSRSHAYMPLYVVWGKKPKLNEKPNEV